MTDKIIWAGCVIIIVVVIIGTISKQQECRDQGKVPVRGVFGIECVRG